MIEIKEKPPNYRLFIDARCNNCRHQREHDDWEVVTWWCEKYKEGGKLGMTCDTFEEQLNNPPNFRKLKNADT